MILTNEPFSASFPTQGFDLCKRNAYESGDEGTDLRSQRVMNTSSSHAEHENINIKRKKSTMRQRKTAASEDEDTDENHENPLFSTGISGTARRNVNSGNGKSSLATKPKVKDIPDNKSDVEENASHSQNGASEKNSEPDTKHSKLPKPKDQNDIANENRNRKHEAKDNGHIQSGLKTNGQAPPDSEVVEDAMDSLSLEGNDLETDSSTRYSLYSDMEDFDAEEEMNTLRTNLVTMRMSLRALRMSSSRTPSTLLILRSKWISIKLLLLRTSGDYD